MTTSQVKDRMRHASSKPLHAVLDEACRGVSVPGASPAVLEGDVIRAAESGVATVATVDPVTAVRAS